MSDLVRIERHSLVAKSPVCHSTKNLSISVLGQGHFRIILLTSPKYYLYSIYKEVGKYISKSGIAEFLIDTTCSVFTNDKGEFSLDAKIGVLLPIDLICRHPVSTIRFIRGSISNGVSL